MARFLDHIPTGHSNDVIILAARRIAPPPPQRPLDRVRNRLWYGSTDTILSVNDSGMAVLRE
jgi:hypothetical protein